MLSSKVGFLVKHLSDISLIIQDWGHKAKDYLGFDPFTGENVFKLTGLASSAIPKFVSATLKAIVDIFVLYFILFFMLMNAKRLEQMVKEYLPFNDVNNRLLLNELKKQTIANSIGIAVLSVIQLLISLIGYTIFGIHEPLFWAVITGLASAIPAVGTGIAWIPLCIITYVSGQEIPALGLALYLRSGTECC